MSEQKYSVETSRKLCVLFRKLGAPLTVRCLQYGLGEKGRTMVHCAAIFSEDLRRRRLRSFLSTHGLQILFSSKINQQSTHKSYLFHTLHIIQIQTRRSQSSVQSKILYYKLKYSKPYSNKSRDKAAVSSILWWIMYNWSCVLDVKCRLSPKK